MKNLIYILTTGIFFFFVGWFLKPYFSNNLNRINPEPTSKPRIFDKYTIEALSRTPIAPENITKEELLETKEDYTTHLISIYFDPTLEGKSKKKVTGIMRTPKGSGTFPLVIMFRGYVDQEIYISGDGSKRASEYFAQNGFITIAPDFLGYGDSDPEASNIFETRFQTYTTALTLISSIKNIEEWNGNDIFIWGHSNGGLIALTALEITSATYPTTLWAPVSKPFPYSILYYTDESADLGKLIRGELAKFETDYDPNLYSIHGYYERINAPIQVHQGSADDAVPINWSDTLVEKLQVLGKDIEYFKYPGADHNLNPAWDTVVERDLIFFKSFIN